MSPVIPRLQITELSVSRFVRAGPEIPLHVSIHYCSPHFCSTAEHFGFCCASPGEDRKGFSLDVFCYKGLSKCNTTNRKYWTCKSDTSWQRHHKCFHCKYKFCCVGFAYFTLTQGFFACWNLLQCSIAEAEAEIPQLPLALLPWLCCKFTRQVHKDDSEHTHMSSNLGILSGLL